MKGNGEWPKCRRAPENKHNLSLYFWNADIGHTCIIEYFFRQSTWKWSVEWALLVVAVGGTARIYWFRHIEWQIKNSLFKSKHGVKAKLWHCFVWALSRLLMVHSCAVFGWLKYLCHPKWQIISDDASCILQDLICVIYFLYELNIATLALTSARGYLYYLPT